MFEVSHSSENHRNIVLVRRVNRILVMDRPARLNDSRDTSLVGCFHAISEGAVSYTHLCRVDHFLGEHLVVDTTQ